MDEYREVIRTVSAFTLQQLRVLAAVVEHRSFTRGAQAIFMTQSAASQHVRALEQALGAALVQRGGNEIIPTRPGEGVVRYAQEILRLADDAERFVASCRAGHAGRLTVGVTGSAVYLVPTLLAAFRTARPGIEVTLQILPRGDLPAALTGGTLDLALASGPVIAPRIATHSLCPDRIVLVSPLGSAVLPVADLQPVSLQRIAGLALIAPASGGPVNGTLRLAEPSLCWQHVERWASAQGVLLRPVLRLEGVDAVKKAVEAGIGLAFLPVWAVEREIALGTLRLVPVDAPPLLREYAMAVYEDRVPDELLQAFLEFAPDHLRARLPRPLVEAFQEMHQASPASELCAAG
jgi:DNA-binding transcriptional LysR family regulator